MFRSVNIKEWEEGRQWNGSGSKTAVDTVRRFLAIVCLAAAIIIFTLSAWNAQAAAGEGKIQPPAGADGSGTDTPACGPSWNIVSSPNQGPDPHRLNGIAAVSANDVWAAGMYDLGAIWRTLVMHWNGSAWSIVPSPNVGASYNHLFGIAAVSTNDVWAVGSYSAGAHLRTLIIHWDGTMWSTVPSPNVGSNDLRSVSAVSANDVWAVGDSYADGRLTTLIMRWDGSAWSIVPSPNVAGSDNYLNGVAAVSANDAWAAGSYRYESIHQPLLLHWNGSAWSQMAIPFVGAGSAVFNSVTTASASDLWLAGYYHDDDVQKTLIVRRNGSTWSVVPSPNVGSYDNQLLGIDFTAPNNGWAAGYYHSTVDKTLILRWNGSAWNIVGGPNNGASNNQLNAVAAVSAADIWTVGNYENASAVERTLVERHNPCVIILPTSTPTPPPATATPLTTPTTCPVQFTDTSEGSTFHPFVRCLACRGILSGYPDGTFRPNDNITRGQISKIVSNAAGFSEPQTGQSFQDVAAGSTFHLFIERLASRGIIGGYACGGPWESCVGPENRPYFRPAGNTTRGQLSKIVCRAYSCTGAPVGQTFEDVPPNHTFYTEIAQLFMLGATNGYPCGGPGEPCGMENKPYFRPGANVSRGQTAKIVANTFFPSCQTP